MVMCISCTQNCSAKDLRTCLVDVEDLMPCEGVSEIQGNYDSCKDAAERMGLNSCHEIPSECEGMFQ